MNKRGPKKVRRVRIGTRLTVELRDRMMRHSATSGLPERAILENALEQYLGGASDHAVLLRRLDQLTAILAEQRREHELLSEMFAVFARFLFSATPPLPEASKAAARSLGDTRYAQFMKNVETRLSSGRRLRDDVPYKSASSAAVPGTVEK